MVSCYRSKGGVAEERVGRLHVNVILTKVVELWMRMALGAEHLTP